MILLSGVTVIIFILVGFYLFRRGQEEVYIKYHFHQDTYPTWKAVLWLLAAVFGFCLMAGSLFAGLFISQL